MAQEAKFPSQSKHGARMRVLKCAPLAPDSALMGRGLRAIELALVAETNSETTACALDGETEILLLTITHVFRLVCSRECSRLHLSAG